MAVVSRELESGRIDPPRIVMENVNSWWSSSLWGNTEKEDHNLILTAARVLEQRGLGLRVWEEPAFSSARYPLPDYTAIHANREGKEILYRIIDTPEFKILETLFDQTHYLSVDWDNLLASVNEKTSPRYLATGWQAARRRYHQLSDLLIKRGNREDMQRMAGYEKKAVHALGWLTTWQTRGFLPFSAEEIPQEISRIANLAIWQVRAEEQPGGCE